MKYHYMTTGFLGWTEEEILAAINKLSANGWEVVSKGKNIHHSWLLKRHLAKRRSRKI